MADASVYEKLGVFYLGKVYDPEARSRTDEPVLYDSRDLVTHAVCVGMTGSGKTGLCIGLLEEAAIDGIPSIVIDPKGDLGNLLLTFPALRPEDFRPWINEDDARRKGVSPDDFAAQQAAMWAKGLADWGQSGERIAKLRSSAEVVIYTPGSSAGVPVSILRSFAAPSAEVMDDGEALRERIASTATSLLGLLKIEADPLTSREHILIAGIIGDAWGRGEDLDLPALIERIQRPPFQRVGVMELESVFPAKERFGLAMALNNLVASPGFGAWLEGAPLDIQGILFTPSGKPRVAVFSIAHLGDAERMFFVSLLMNQVLGWVRAQSGTTSLRALVYMDEIAGYVPPIANPPSKWPILTLMKQARAFGVGVVLATQNPVDIDYKGLSNAGTWLLGRLQTERDKARVLDGLEAASASAGVGLDRAACDRLLSGLEPRVFLLHNVHESGPVVMQARWAMSYLRGPLTRGQIKSLMDPRRAELVGGGARTAGAGGAARGGAAASGAASGVGAGAVSAAGAVARPAAGGASGRPTLPPEVPEFFVPARASGGVSYTPMLLASGRVYYKDAKTGVDHEAQASMLAPFGDGPVVVDWDHAEPTELTDKDVERSPVGGSAFGALPSAAAKAKSYEEWKKGFAEALFRTHSLTLLRSPSLGELSAPGEAEAAFRARLAHAAREERDAAAEKLKAKYGPRLATLQDRLRRSEQAVAKQKEQSAAAKVSTAVSFGTAILSAVLGRKTVSATSVGRVATAARAGGRAVQEAKDVGRAEETAEAVRAQLSELDAQFREELDALASRIDPSAEELETVVLRPKKTNIQVRAVVLAWTPRGADGSPLW